MKLVSPLLKHVVYPGLSKGGFLQCAAAAGPMVLTYHGVLPPGYKVVDPALDGNLVSTDSFREQLQLLKNRYHPISPKEFPLWCEGDHELPARSVLLTSDDGLRSSLSDMLPILQEFELECLFFVTGASLRRTATMLWYEELYLMFLAAPASFSLDLPDVGLRVEIKHQEKRSVWWQLVKRLSRFDSDLRRAHLGRIRTQLGLSEQWDVEYREDPALNRRFMMLNLPELHQLAEAGMCIGAHTLSHPMLSQVSPDVAWKEISESKHELEQELGREVWALAYPFGDSFSVTSRELQMAKRAGLKAAFFNVSGDIGPETSRLALPRVHISAAMSPAEFEAHISGAHRSFQELFRLPSRSAVGSNA